MLTLEQYLGNKFPAIYHVVVTGRCNAKCEGCVNTLIYGERVNFSLNWESEEEKNLHILKNLIHYQNSHSPIYIAFYGGEPLLVPEKINFYYKNLNNLFNNRDLRYILFTNGMLLDSFVLKEYELLKKLSLLIVSIDGQKEQHEKVRKGTNLDRIENNLALFKQKTSIPVLMWSTIRDNMRLKDCLEEFLKLYNSGICDYFFWHLIESEKPIENFQHFRDNYIKDLEQLIDLFLQYLNKGFILPILPLCELYYFLLKNIRRGQTGCGVERLRNLDIVSGKILPCVDLGDEICFENLSELEQGKLLLSQIVQYKELQGCSNCSAEFYCGGRCPVLIKVSPQRSRQYCILTKKMVELVKQSVKKVESLLKKHGLNPEDLYFPYGYLALLTDVVP